MSFEVGADEFFNRCDDCGRFNCCCEEEYWECYGGGFDPENIEHLCQNCFKHEALINGICGMCSELEPYLI